MMHRAALVGYYLFLLLKPLHGSFIGPKPTPFPSHHSPTPVPIPVPSHHPAEHGGHGDDDHSHPTPVPIPFPSHHSPTPVPIPVPSHHPAEHGGHFIKTTTLVHSFSHSYGHATFPPTLKFSSGELSHSYSYSLCFDDCNENCFKYHLGNCAQSCDEETKMWIEDICGQNSFPCAASCGEEDDPCSSDCYSGCPGE